MKTNIKESKETPSPNWTGNPTRNLGKERKNIKDKVFAKCLCSQRRLGPRQVGEKP